MINENRNILTDEIKTNIERINKQVDDTNTKKNVVNKTSNKANKLFKQMKKKPLNTLFLATSFLTVIAGITTLSVGSNLTVEWKATGGPSGSGYSVYVSNVGFSNYGSMYIRSYSGNDTLSNELVRDTNLQNLNLLDFAAMRAIELIPIRTSLNTKLIQWQDDLNNSLTPENEKPRLRDGIKRIKTQIEYHINEVNFCYIANNLLLAGSTLFGLIAGVLVLGIFLKAYLKQAWG